MRFAPGRLILHRNVRHGRIGWVRPVHVVSDDERGLLVWLARDSAVGSEVTRDGRGMRSMPFTEWVGHDYRVHVGSWQGPGVLKFHPVGAGSARSQLASPAVATTDLSAHSVWWFRDDAGRFTHWYVNLEEPGVRWDDGAVAGIDVVDQDLDVLARHDRSWEWKDEEEFVERLALPGHYWVPDEAAVRAEGERVVKLIEAGEFPFDGTWCDFTPDPAWPVPTQLPPGWDRPPAR